MSMKDDEVVWPHTSSLHISEGDLIIIITCDDVRTHHIVTEVQDTAPGVQKIALLADPCE